MNESFQVIMKWRTWWTNGSKLKDFGFEEIKAFFMGKNILKNQGYSEKLIKIILWQNSSCLLIESHMYVCMHNVCIYTVHVYIYI